MKTASGQRGPSFGGHQGLVPGVLLAGKYRVVQVLEDQRGQLVEAAHTEFQRRVTIRYLPACKANEKSRERFRREAMALAKLESVHAARITDVGTHPSGSYFYVREHLAGESLAEYLERTGPMASEHAVRFVLEAAEAVAECHLHHIVLRELDPSCIFVALGSDGAPMIKVTDFGTAKFLRNEVPSEMTTIRGVSPYASPELVARRGSADPRTDVWSLGCVLYELLTGRPPFAADQLAELLNRIVRRPHAPVRAYRSDINPGLEEVLKFALEKNREQRFQSVAAFARGLMRYADPEGQVVARRIQRLAERPPVESSPLRVSPTSPLAPEVEAETMAIQRPAPSEPGGAPVVEGPEDDHAQTHAIRRPPAAGADRERSSDRLPRPRGIRLSVPTPPGVPRPPPIPRLVTQPSVPPAPVTWNDTTPKGATVPASAPPSTATLRAERRFLWGFAAAMMLAPTLVVASILLFRAPDVSRMEVLAPLPMLPVEFLIEMRWDQKSAEATPDPVQPAATERAESEALAALARLEAAADETPAPEEQTDGAKASRKRKTGSRRVRGPAPAKRRKNPAARKAQPRAEPAADGMLVAIAIGGKCAFAIDGVAKGVASSVRATVARGKHVVTCAARGGAPQTRSVRVDGDRPAIASFRLK